MTPQLENKSWERLHSVIQWSNMTINYFAHHIGLANGENLYRIKRGQNNVSRRLAETIVATFPDIDPVWLLTGRGAMLTPEASQSRSINYYDRDAEQFVGEVERLEPRSLMILPEMVDAEFAMLYMGDAMGMVTPRNTIIMLQRVDVESVIFGKEYLIECEKFSLLRFVRSGDDGEKLRLRAVEQQEYDDIEVECSAVKSVYRVVAKMIINS